MLGLFRTAVYVARQFCLTMSQIEELLCKAIGKLSILLIFVGDVIPYQYCVSCVTSQELFLAAINFVQ